MTIEQGIAHQQAGRLAEAEAIYRKILSQNPNHADALHLLGLIAFQAGNAQATLELINRAISINPAAPNYHSNLGLVLAAAGRLDEAIASYERALKLHPDFAEAWNGLGNALTQKKNYDAAARAFDRALQIVPKHLQAINNRGNLFLVQHDLDQAIDSFRQAIVIKPDFPQAHANLGQALLEKGLLDEAIASFHQALLLAPGDHLSLDNLGNALRKSGRLEEAEVAFRQALSIRPDLAITHNNLGATMLDQGKLEEAAKEFGHAMGLKHEFPEAINNMGSLLQQGGEIEQAARLYQNAIQLRPDWSLPKYNLGTAHMLQGDFHSGLPLLEQRWNEPELVRFRQGYTQPAWDGGDLRGKTILLFAEQGFGDTIQFIRYVPQVIQRGGRVLLRCQNELVSLLRSIDGVEQVLGYDDPLPRFDVHCSIISLPLMFGTTEATIPKTVPYLFADAQKKSRWRERLVGFAEKKIGLVWAGRPTHRRDRARSISLASLSPLIRTEGTIFISLQKGNSIVPGSELIDWTNELHDFSDTAALIDNLDLIITVDTSIAHLAGAMGRPVWVLIPFAPDWRWMLDREDSPWYPTMRLFRQSRRDDWSTPIERMARELKDQK